MTAITGVAPVLLLDEAFSELDEATARALMVSWPMVKGLDHSR